MRLHLIANSGSSGASSVFLLVRSVFLSTIEFPLLVFPIIESLKLKTEILWRKPLAEKGLASADIRGYMATNQPWEHLVPPAVARTMKELGLIERIRKLMKE